MSSSTANRTPLLLALLCLFSSTAAAQELVGNQTDIVLRTQRHGSLTNLTIVPFSPVKQDAVTARLALETQNVLRQDLMYAQSFNLLDVTGVFTGKKNEFAFFGSKGAAVLVTGKLGIAATYYFLNSRVYDVETGDLVFGRTFTSEARDIRELAHKLNDDIIFAYSGRPGIAHTRIVFTNNSTGSKEIYIIDYDGHNLKRLTSDRSVCIFPRWSPDGKNIIFASYRRGNPDLYIMRPDGTGRRLLSSRPGLNVPAAYSVTGDYIAITLSRGALPNIYLLNTGGELIRQITNDSTLNTSPSFAANGRDIAFVSGRAGMPQIYITDIYGTTPRRMYTDGYTDSPSYSLDSKMLTFAMRKPGQSIFDIYVYDITRSMYWTLTDGVGSNENPTFSPDSRMVAYTSLRFKHRELYVIYLDGRVSRRIADMAGDCFTPNWSQ